MAKRIAAGFLCAVLLLTSLPTVFAARVTKGQISQKLDELVEVYDGQMFTESYHGSIQCKGFADMIFAMLFGVEYIGPYVQGDYYYLKPLASGVRTVGQVDYLEEGDAQTVRKVLEQALPGDYIQIRRRLSYGQGHSMIVLDVTDDGITVFHSNWTKMFTNGVSFFTWDQFAGIANAFSLYHYDDYDPQGGFTDVPTGEWYYDVVKRVTDLGLMTGMSESQFAPDANMTRAQLVTVLYRLDGQDASYTSTFTDAAAGSWYADAVGWAQENGIVNGYKDGRFGVGDNVTREDTATILYRYAAYKGYTVDQQRDLTAFSDGDQVSNYAKTPMSWAVGCTVIGGNSDGTLRPRSNATRAQLAKMVSSFWDIYGAFEPEQEPAA